jgi:hypothetical protein
MIKTILQPGLRFSKLVLVEKLYNDGKNTWWLCKCDCGEEKKLRSVNLRNKIRPIRSCGCLGDSLKLDKGESSFNKLFIRYKKAAAERNLEFTLTREEFRLLTKGNCYYCGIAPCQEFRRTKRSNGSYIYSGVDRLNNVLGYSIKNCVSSCSQCNFLKGKFQSEEFLTQIKKIYTHQNKGII